MSEPPTKQQKTDGEPATEAIPGESRAAMQSSVSKETPISIPPTITYGLQDTHTTVIPTVFWFSLPNIQYQTPLCFRLTLNSIYSFYGGGDNMTGLTFLETGPTAGDMWSRKCKDLNHPVASTTTSLKFPATLSSNAITPWWRTYWEKLYKYYSVLGCEYEIIFSNPRSDGQDNLVGYSIETTGTANASLTPSNLPLSELMAQKNIRYLTVPARKDVDKNVKIISGYHKVGSAKKDVANDGDVKLWTETTQSTSYKEMLQILTYQHPLATQSDAAATNIGTTNTGHHLNVQVRLKYTVQYKQLKPYGKYPQTVAGGNTTTITVPENTISTMLPQSVVATQPVL